MLNDLDMLPNKTNWAYLVRNLLMSLGLRPRLGLPRPKAIVVIPKNQPLPKY